MTFFGSAHAAQGPKLTRRGMLFGMGATAVALNIPNIISEAAASTTANISAAASPAPTSQFVLLDEFQTATAGDLEFFRKVLNVRTTDFSNIYAVQAADLGGRSRVMQMGMVDGMNFADGIVQTVQRQTFSAIQNLIEKKPDQPLETIERLIEKLEPGNPVPCETKVTKQEALLVIEESPSSRGHGVNAPAPFSLDHGSGVSDGGGVHPHPNSPHQ